MDDKDRKPGTGKDRPADAPKDTGGDKARDRTLTEKAEEGAGGANRKTPGPIYDV